MTHTPEQLAEKGKSAMREVIEAKYQLVARQIRFTREHYETGHGGEHGVLEKIDPQSALYQILGSTLLDLQQAALDPKVFTRAELVSWFMSALMFQTLPADTSWEDFESGMLAGLEMFRDRQIATLDNPRSQEIMQRTGAMVLEAEAKMGQPE